MDTNPFVQCPFNRAHRVPQLRLQYHILKCGKNYHGFKKCPYNATHIMKDEEFADHVITCDDAKLIEGHKYLGDLEGHGDLRSGKFHFIIQQDENWDQDPLSDLTISDYESDDLADGQAENSHDDSHDFVPDFDDNEQPLHGLFHSKKKSESSLASSFAGSDNDKPEEASSVAFADKFDTVRPGPHHQDVNQFSNAVGVGRGKRLQQMLSKYL